jgi:GNAT superfamily N-acetyltransferase
MPTETQRHPLPPRPPFELELVAEAQLSPELDRAIRELLCVCFPPDVAVFSQSRHWHGSAPAYSLVQRQGGAAVGHVGVVVREIRAGRSPVLIAGIQNLAVRPDGRKSGLGPELMTAAMAEARRRQIPFGLLFCVPALEKFYRALGWVVLPVDATMRDEAGRSVPIPGKNICMALSLGPAPFPPGDLDLRGPDW